MKAFMAILRSLKELYNDLLQAEDGDIGCCSDFLFDDDGCMIHYLVADTGTWLPDRKVRISSILFGMPLS
jgi:hypothetical protein